MTGTDGLARRVDVGGWALHVADFDDATSADGFADADGGAPVLVLHGFAGSTRTMMPLIEALAARRRVIALDLIGHGASHAPHDASAYRWPAVTRHVLRVLDALDLASVHLLGFSLGGRIALQVAARHDHRVRSVVTVGSRCTWTDDRERAARRAKDAALADRIAAQGIAALSPGDVRDDALAAAAPRAGTHGLALALRGLGAADQPDVAAALALAAVPLLLVAGERDAGPLASAHALAADLPCARTVAIAGAGHRAHLEQTAQVAALADDFFASADAAHASGSRPHDAGAPRAAGAQGEQRW